MQAGLAIKSTTHEAWEAIRKVRLGADHVREANAEWLRREFSDLAFRPDETMEDFSLWLTTVVSQLRVLGDEVSDKEVVKKLLHVIPNNLKQVVISMETLLDLKSLSIEEVDDHLRAIEQRKKPSPSKEAGCRLLLTEEEWMARMKTCDGSSSNAGSRSGGGKNRGNKQGVGEGKKSSTGCNDVCDCCSKKGHWARECCKKKRDAEAQAMWPTVKRRSRVYSWRTHSSPSMSQPYRLCHAGGWRLWSRRSSPTSGRWRSMTTSGGSWTRVPPTT
jgi:hypothetical protein